jgi:hypothetical protein
MGHHLAADVKLGPWVYRTRRAIARAADRFEGSSFWLHLPFFAYAELFMKISLRISRAQELSADARAVSVAGPGPTASALRKIEVLGAAWEAYFHTEVLPIVDQKRLPPLLDGFQAYWRAAQTPDTPAFRLLSSALAASKRPSNEDTHPTLEERLAAIDSEGENAGVLSARRPMGDPAPESEHAAPALALLDRIPEAEDGVLRDLLRDAATVLAPVAWDSVGADVWLPLWREAVGEAPPLTKLAIGSLACTEVELDRIARETRRGPAVSSPAAERRRVTQLLSAWLTVRLADAGFRVVAAPGLAVAAERGEERIEPFGVVEKVARGEMDAGGWAELCAAHGLR